MNTIYARAMERYYSAAETSTTGNTTARRRHWLLTLTVLLCSLSIPDSVFSQSGCNTWSGVGPTVANLTTGTFAPMVVDNNNIFVAVGEAFTNARLSVKKFNGAGWDYIGPAGFSTHYNLSLVKLAVYNGNPIVAYTTGEALANIYVSRYNGTNWVDVNTSAISSTSNKQGLVIKTDGSGNMFLSCLDVANILRTYKYNGTTWVQQGTGITVGGIAGPGPFFSMDVDASGVPYIIYTSTSTFKGIVMKFNGTSWVAVGNTDFTPALAYLPSIKLSGATPYISYVDITTQKAHVMKLNGSTWEYIGGNSGIFTIMSGPQYYVMGLDNAGTPYVSCWNIPSTSGLAIVKKFNGTSWETVGSTFSEVSGETQPNLSLGFDNSNTPILGYMRDGNTVPDVPRVIRYGAPAINGINTTSYDLGVGTTFQLIGTPGGGTWSSASPSTATIGSSTGLVSGAATGSSAISYVVGSCTATTTVTVSPSYTVTPTAGANGSIWPSNVLRVREGNSQVFYMTPSSGYYIAGVTVDGASVGSVATYTFSGSASAHTIDVSFSPDSIICRSWDSVSTGSIATGVGSPSYQYTSYLRWGKFPMAMNSNTPYVAYIDVNNSNKLSVKKMTGSTWVNVGAAGFSSGAVLQPQIVFASGTPYVAFINASTSKATVMKFNGSTWDVVGTENFSVATDQVALGINSSGIPHVAFKALSDYKVTVMRFSGGSWQNVGDPSFMQIGANPSLAFDLSGNPILAFAQYNSAKAAVMRFDGSIWSVLGNWDITTNFAECVSVKVSSTGTIYLMTMNNNRARVFRLENGIWIQVGADVGTLQTSGSATLGLDNSDVPYVAYEEWTSTSLMRATVKKFNGFYWVTVGNSLFAPYDGSAVHTTMDMDSNGDPWVLTQSNASYTRLYKLVPFSPPILGAGGVCVGATLPLTNTLAGGVWSSVSPEIATIGTSGIVTGQAEGTSVISYAISPTCVSTATATVLVTPTVAVITGSTNVSTGELTILANATGGGTWASSNTSKATVSNYGVVTGVSTGTANITYNVSSGSCSAFAVKAMTVDATVCAGFHPVGTSISSGSASHDQLAINNSNTIYTAFRDGANDGKVTVKRYNGTSWETLGSEGFSLYAVSSPKLAIASNGTVYVAYTETENIGKITVQRYNGSGWDILGSAFSTSVSYIALTTDISGNPVLAYSTTGEASGKAKVLRYSGSSWATIGNGVSAGAADNFALATKNDGTLYLAYRDLASSTGGPTVLTYSGASWTMLGTQGFSESGDATSISLKLSIDGTPYICYGDQTYGYKPTARKYSGGSWNLIGSRGFATGDITDASFVVDANGTPYVSYLASDLAKVKKYNGSAWVDMVTSSISPSDVFDVAALTVDNNGAPIVAYHNSDDDGKVVVRKYTSGPSYILTSSAGAHGSISPSGTVNVCASANQVYTITPASGYHVQDVTVDGASAGAVTTYTFAVVAGTHTIAATFEENCNPPTNTSAATVVNVNCRGGSTGSVTPNVSGNTPFTWTWSNGATTSTISSLPAGVYTYTVTNICGSVTGTATVTQPATALTPTNTVTNVLCYGASTGSVSVTATGGTAPYTGTGNFTGKAAGTHTFTVTDNKGCTATTSATVSQPASALSATATSIHHLNCHNEGFTGSVNIAATGGVEPYTGTGPITDLDPGFFSFPVTDANGCVSNATGTIINPAPFTVEVHTVTPVSCFGRNDGVIFIAPSGGTSPYPSGASGYRNDIPGGNMTYIVHDANGCSASDNTYMPSPAPLEVSSTATPAQCFGGYGHVEISASGGNGYYSGIGGQDLVAGTYHIPVTDIQGCTDTAHFTIAQPTSPVTASKTVTNVNCYGQNNGAVLVSATGGATPYTGTGNMTGLSAGPFSYTVTDANGCTSTVSGTVNQPALLVASKTVTDVRCNSETNGAVTVSATGGTTPYTGTGIFSSLPAGPFSYTVTDNKGCTSTVTGTITQPAVLAASSTSPLSASGFNLLCNGGTGIVSVTATGGTTPYSGTGNITGRPAGAYSLTVTDAHGCTAVTTGSLTQPDPFYISISSSKDTVCNGSTATLTAIGSTSGYTWAAETGLAGGYATSPVTATGITGTAVATFGYRAVGYNEHNCLSVPDTVNITVLPIGYFSGPGALCTGYSIDLDNSTPGGVWYTPDNTLIGLDQNGLVTGTAVGAATISYTMPNGCRRTTVETVNPTPIPIVGIAGVCPGTSLSVPAGSPGGGVWSSSNSNITVTTATNGVATLFGAVAGTANVSYTMPTGCYAYKTFTVAPLAAITGPTQVCAGNTIQLSHPLMGAQWTSGTPAMASVNVNTGLVTGISASPVVISYKVNPSCYVTYNITVNTTPVSIAGPTSVCTGTGINLTNATTGGTWVSSNTAAGTVGSTSGIVTGVDMGVTNISYVMPNGCYKATAVTVNQAPAAITGLNNVCATKTATFAVATTGGSWSSSSSVLAINAGTGVANGVAAGNANVSYTMPTGCASYKAVTVAAVPAAITGTTTVCEGSTTTLSSTTSALTWSSTDENAATIAPTTATTGTVSGLLAGTSVISYTSAAGCTQTVNVTVYASPGTIGGVNSVCAGSTATYTNIVTGGTWSSSATSIATVGSLTGIVTGIGGGSFNLTYTMPGGCRAIKAVTINALPATISGTLNTCVGGNTTLSSATTGQTWSVAGAAASVDATTGVVTGLAIGTVSVSYTNTAGCARFATVNVTTGLPAITGPASICAGSSATLSNTTTGGTWASSSGAAGTIVSTSGLLTGISAGNTNITYRTSPTCFTTTSMTVLTAPAAITGPATSVCVNAPLQLAHTTTGGTWNSSLVAKAAVDATSGLVTGVAAGNTTISYTTAPGCVATYNITVNAIPNAITGTATVCDGLTTTLATTSTGGSWISSTPGTGTVSTTGVVTGIDAGTTTISYKFSTTGCHISRDVTVNALPNSITGDNSVCAGVADTFMNTTPGGTWSSSVTTIAAIGSATGILNGIAAGTTTLSYTLATGCRTTKVFTVYAIPATGITGTSTLCESATTTLNCTTAGLTWSSSNTDKATVVTGTTTSGIVTGVAAGTSTISYTNASGCARTIVVTVGIAPQTISGTSSACAGRVDTFTNASPGGTWSSSAPSAATIGSATGYLTGVAAGTTVVSYTLNGCRKTMTVTVNTQPGSISGSSTLCGGNMTTLTATNSGGAWSSSNTDIATVASGSSTTAIVTGGATTGTAAISYSLVAGCARVIIVTVNAALPAVSGPETICVGTTGTFISGSGGTWISSNTAKASIGYNTGVATGVAAGNTTLTYKVNATCFAVKDVTVNASVAAITGTTNVCKDNVTTLACATPGGTWSSSNTDNATVAETSGVVTGTTAGTATITYQVSATGCFKTASVNVLASPAPIEGTLTLAVGTTTTLNNTVGGGTWSSSAATVANIGSASGIMNGVAPGTATITYKLINGCGKTAIANIVSSLARPVKSVATTDAGMTMVRIFPNPSQGNITIEAPLNGVFTIHTIDGKQLVKLDVTSPATSVALPSDLAAGMYMCTFEDMNGERTVIRLVYKP